MSARGYTLYSVCSQLFLFLFQFNVRATDSGNPARSTDMGMTINIDRSALPIKAPQFFTTDYTTTIDETAPLNSNPVSVQARLVNSQVNFITDSCIEIRLLATIKVKPIG